MVDAEVFAEAVRTALAERDRQRGARLFDPHNYAAADAACIAAVAQAAGITEPESTVPTLARARRAAKKNYERAFGDDLEAS